MTNETDQFYTIAKEIVSIFGKIFAARPYIAIVDALGNILHIDEPLSDQHFEFVKTYVKTNFNMLKVGEYSVPLGGINLAFFKISPKAMIVIFTTKGFTGQLLAFRTRMFEWSDKIDEVIGELGSLSTQKITIPEPIEPSTPVESATPVELRTTVESTTPIESAASVKSIPPVKSPPPIEPAPVKDILIEKGFRKLPVLKRKLTGKEKFTIEIASILQFCDGKHSVDEICKETKYPRIKVNQILKDFQKKGWIQFKRVIT